MPLTLVLGPANSAKAGEVLGAYASAARRGAVLVVPTSADARVYERELAGSGAMLGGTVVTFAGLAREIARRVGYAGRRLSPLQRELVLARAVAAVPLTALSRSARARGFAGALGDLVSELERSLVSPARFAQAAGGELASLYLAYDRELERLGRVDDELYVWRALDALRASPRSWGRDAVFFYGFDDLHPLQRDAVETLARVVGVDVTVSLTYEPAREALRARAETVQELSPLAERTVELPALPDYYADDALHRLERGLFCDAGERFDPGDAVRLLEAGGERAEAELIAAEVLELVRSGVPGEQIVICHRTPAAVSGLFERVFADFGLTLASERELPFVHTVIGRGVIALARCALVRNASVADALAWLRTPGVVASLDGVDALEATLRRSGRTRAVDAVERMPDPFSPLGALRDDAFGSLRRVAVSLLVGPRTGSAPVLDESESLDARAVGVLERALEDLSELGEELEPQELISVLAELPVPAGRPPAPGVVLLAEPLAIRARRFGAVFVCGLQEGAFPRPGVPDPFLSDERRRELADRSGLRVGVREDALARERYLFYACVSRATERVVLSWRSSDEEGNLALPSPFIADVAELFEPGWSARRRTRTLADVVWPTAEAPVAREWERSVAAAAAPAFGEPATPRYELTDAALGLVRHSALLSAGALEGYADCPVRWLVERELQPERFEPGADSLARGSLIHAVLERLLARLGGPVTSESLPEALALLEELLAEIPTPIGAGRPAPVRAAALRQVEADLRRYLEHEAASGTGWRQEGLELRFGFADEQGSLPALTLGDGEVRVRGVIDRVDVDGAGHAVVRDYKSGGARQQHPAGRWSADRQLQVPLYMLAVRQLLDLEPVAGFYQPLGGGDLRGRGVFVDGAEVGSVVDRDARSAAELDGLLDDAAERAVALARRLRAGDVTPCPQTCTRAGCAFPGICRAV
ncbi:MAG TPA: PD-(D/E)XK nuclease family protein [Solirubrobacteraceae bacterium]|nr:PD-(D/E)XK nuclease family protein [Solirubrobacteraceae bacterium]